MITISETAHEYIRRELAEHLPRSVNEIEGRGIIPHARLGTQEYNEEFGGYRYIFFEDIFQDGDISLDFTDYVILVHIDHIDSVNGTHIDYRTEGLQKRLDFMNPNLKEVGPTCGCGTSIEFDNVAFAGIPQPEPFDADSLLNTSTVEEEVVDEDIISETKGS